ncbi:MAG TPA: type IV pilus assembly protein PilM [Candidatus Saccharimonadales bacterium]|nr:type IV pilus assembly protein PilM [Candidatus Saccharimonadales bacterium]
MGMFGSEVEYFGVDIGSSAVRLVQLKRSGSKPGLVTYGSAPIEQAWVQGDSPADADKIAGVVKQLVKDAKVTTKHVVAGLPSSRVFASVISTPKLGANELGRAIELQAEQYIPMSVKDAKLDWVVIGPGKTDKEQEVLIVAAPNSVTERYVGIFERAGLELMALEPNAVALARAVVAPGDLAVLVLDIGSVATDITIVHANMPKLLRSINIGGSTMVAAAAQALGLDAAQADQFVRKFGLTQTKLEGQVLKALKPTIDQVTSEIDKSIKFFNGNYPEIKFEKIILTGGTTAMPELPAYLSTATGLKIEVANAWTKVAYPAQMQETLMGISTSYGVAAGLAERDLLG